MDRFFMIGFIMLLAAGGISAFFGTSFAWLSSIVSLVGAILIIIGIARRGGGGCG